MGTHPIFESDFDCLTEFNPKITWILESEKSTVSAIEVTAW